MWRASVWAAVIGHWRRVDLLQSITVTIVPGLQIIKVGCHARLAALCPVSGRVTPLAAQPATVLLHCLAATRCVVHASIACSTVHCRGGANACAAVCCVGVICIKRTALCLAGGDYSRSKTAAGRSNSGCAAATAVAAYVGLHWWWACTLQGGRAWPSSVVCMWLRSCVGVRVLGVVAGLHCCRRVPGQLRSCTWEWRKQSKQAMHIITMDREGALVLGAACALA